MQLVEWRPVRPTHAGIATSTAPCNGHAEGTSRVRERNGEHAWNGDLRTKQAVADEIRFKLKIQPTDRVLEVRVGSGGFLSLLLLPGQNGVSFDLCAASDHRGVLDGTCSRPIPWGETTPGKLSLPSCAFDKVVCCGAMSCLPDQEAAIRLTRELVRVCREGGRIFIGHVPGMWEKPRRLLIRLGLRERMLKTLWTIASPLWQLCRRCNLRKRTELDLCRSVFRRAVADLGCEVQFNTSDSRSDGDRRFDVCIHKCAASYVGEPFERKRTTTQKPAAGTLTLQRFSSFDDLLPFRDEWDALAQRVGADLFASFDWYATWWKHFQYDRHPEFFLARADGRLVACLPFFRETIGYGPWRIFVIRLAGSCDAGTRCDLAIEPDYIPTVFPEVLRRLEETGPWDVIHIGDLPGDYAHGRTLAQALRHGACKARVNYRTGYYSNAVFDIPESYEQYLSRLSQNERSSIRRTERRLAEDHHAIIENVPLEGVDAAFDEFLQQHEAWWARSGHLGYFRDWPGSMEFHRDFSKVQARQGRLHLLRLSAGDDTIGFHYCHRFGERIHWFSGSRSTDARWDPYSPGRQLHCAIVRQAVEHGVTQIDGMNGYFEYKKRWGARYNQLQNITVFSQDAWSRLAIRDFRSASRLHYLYNRIWYWHAAPWLRKQFPQSALRYLQNGQTQKFVRTRFMEYASADQADDAVCYAAP